MLKDRIRTLRHELEMTQEELARVLGVGKAALSMIETGKAGLTNRNLDILVQKFNVSPDWLTAGKGKMFTTSPDLRNFYQAAEGEIRLQSVPLYSTAGSVSLHALLQDGAEDKYQPINYIHIPNLPKCDGAIYVHGDSMYPLLKSGDIVLYKRLSDLSDIFWGDMYLLSLDIDGEEHVMVKYMEQSDREGFTRLSSENKRHADKEISLDKIKSMAIIRASIRMNSMQ